MEDGHILNCSGNHAGIKNGPGSVRKNSAPQLEYSSPGPISSLYPIKLLPFKMKSAIAISLLYFSAVGAAVPQVAGTADFKFPPPPPPPGYKPPSGGPGSPSSIKNLKDKIKTVVHILMENRSFDNLVGGQTSLPVDGPARNGPFCNPANLSVPHSTLECTAPRDLDVIANDPDHSVSGNNFEFYGTFHPNDTLIQSGKLLPSQAGFVENQIRRYNLNDSFAGTQIMHFYTPEQVPVITSFCENFVTFDKWHSCVPGVSTQFITLR
jgi:hypothetical protein